MSIFEGLVPEIWIYYYYYYIPARNQTQLARLSMKEK
jgi:hypothetical protein